MNPDGTGLKEFPLPNPGSSPRIIALGSDGNMWFSEHTGNRMGRITPDGTITEFPIPTPNSMPRAIALGADGNIWFGEFAGGKIGRITPQGDDHRVPDSDARQRPARAAAGPGRQHLVLRVQRQQDRPHHAAGVITEFTLPRPNSGPGDITAGADGNMWFVELPGRWTAASRMATGSAASR